jgi:hypothetical protein
VVAGLLGDYAPRMFLTPVALAATASLLTASGGITAKPHYQSCGQGEAHGVQVYASAVSCATARVVERKCRASSCFGQLPMTTATDFQLPTLPTSKPLGFACWQAYGRYAMGLPLPPKGREVFLILCERSSGIGARQLVAYTQLGA